MNYFELYPGDYLRDTTRLSLIEHGAYLRLLMAYYAEEGPLPTDLDELYTAAGATSSVGKKAVKKVAEKYFPQGPDGMRHNARADAEIAKAAERMEGSAEKRAGDLERQRRTRERRAALFSELRAVGIVPDALVPMAELRALHEQHVTRDKAVTDGVTRHANVTDVTGVNTATRSQTPYTNQEQELQARASSQDPPARPPDEPMPEARACLLLKQAGCVMVNPSHPDLVAAIAEGVTPEAIRDAYLAKPDARNPFAYAIGAARGQHAEGAKPISTGPPHAGKPPIAQNFAEKTYTGTPDDQLPEFLRADSA